MERNTKTYHGFLRAAPSTVIRFYQSSPQIAFGTLINSASRMRDTHLIREQNDEDLRCLIVSKEHQSFRTCEIAKIIFHRAFIP